MSRPGFSLEIPAVIAKDLVLLDHSYAALVVPLPSEQSTIHPSSDPPDPVPEPLVSSSSTELETPLDRGLRHAEDFYKKLVRESSQKQVLWIMFPVSNFEFLELVVIVCLLT